MAIKLGYWKNLDLISISFDLLLERIFFLTKLKIPLHKTLKIITQTILVYVELDDPKNYFEEYYITRRGQYLTFEFLLKDCTFILSSKSDEWKLFNYDISIKVD